MADIIQLLVGLRKEQFEHEAAVRLFQFRTWILSPDDIEGIKTAGQIAASHFLENIRRPGFYSKTNEERFSSAALTRMFENETYRRLFDTMIARYGGWTSLMDISAPEFEKKKKELNYHAGTTSMMMDYLFRCRDHEERSGFGKRAPPPRLVANISHAMFYVWKSKQPISGKTLRNRWRQTKQSSVFVYASTLLRTDLYSMMWLGADVLANLTADAKNLKRNREFFAVCRWIADKIPGELVSYHANLLPRALTPVRPMTVPLDERAMKLMDCYDDESHKMRNS
ncbi:MAG: hypothetical protein WCG92_23335 [Hyphomicrobiales bacterium]